MAAAEVCVAPAMDWVPGRVGAAGLTPLGAAANAGPMWVGVGKAGVAPAAGTVRQAASAASFRCSSAFSPWMQ